MTDSSRAQGLLICVGTVVLAALFLLGIFQGAYWALAVPVGLLVLFVLGLAFWVGWTIATIRVEPEPDPDTPADPAPPASPDASA